MVEHDEFGVSRVELHMGDPAQGYLFLIEECSRGGVVDTEITVQPLFLHAAVDVIDRPTVQTIPFLVGVVVQGPAVGHRDAEQFSIATHMGKGRCPVIGHLVEHLDGSVQSHLADLVVLDIIDDVTGTVQTHAGLAQPLAVMVVGQPFLLACGQIPDIDVGMAVAVADDIQPLVVAAEGGTGEIEQLGVVSALFAFTSAYKYPFFHRVYRLCLVIMFTPHIVLPCHPVPTGGRGLP